MADEATPTFYDNETASTEASQSSSPAGSGAYILRTLSLDSLSTFWSLPRELQQRIIFLSCQEPCLDRRTIVGRCIDHTTTILGLIKACRLFYIWVLPLLYRNVRLPRPSVLVQFQRTLADHPGLSQLVRRIHIGPDEVLSQDWFPMRTCDCGRDDHITFRLNEEKPEGEWDYLFEEVEMDHNDEKPKDDLVLALAAALKSASEALNVSSHRRNFSQDGTEIGSDAWHVRVLEVQAAVEVYFVEMRKLPKRTQEEGNVKEPGSNGETSLQTQMPYPRLLVDVGGAESPGRTQAVRCDTFRVTRSQILARLTSPGSMTDFFNHPILFARTSLPWYAKGPDDEEHEGGVEDSEIGGVEHIPDVLAPSALGHVSAISADCWDFHPLPGSSTTTVGGNIVLARSVLSMVPNLLSLSLTGIFDRILMGGQPLSYKWLRKATIGPPPSLDWYAPLETSQSALDSIEQLRICDTCLLESNVAELTGNSAALPRLKKLQWSISSE